ncbi:MAG: ABC transporter permease, partial [Deltaproteobacteria bacterium]|nr:ABC transporter permease [Deltaproteobacteria bacterium]
MHAGRALTVLCGIALGAAVFTSVRLSVNASLDSFSRSMDLIAGRADRVLIRPAGRVPEKLVSILLAHPSVESASPLLTTYIRPAQEGAEPFLLIGLDPILDRSIRNWHAVAVDNREADSWLELLQDPNTLIISNFLASEYRLGRGDIISIEHTDQKADFRVIGILAPEGLSLVEGGRVALTDIATFQEFTGLHGFVDRIDLLFKPDTSSADLDEIAEKLPVSVTIGAPSATKKSGQEMIRAYQLNLSILSFASLFVGMFLVYSLVALNAATRRHELAVLRSTGASPFLLFLIFLAEGALLGVVGWLAAIPISSILIKYLLSGVSQTISTLFVRVQVDQLSFSLWELVLSFGVTVSVAVLAALQPAREAMLVSPKEALETSQLGGPVKKSPRKLAQSGLLCIMLVFPFSQIPAIFGVPILGYAAILLLFVGFSFLAPWLLVLLGDLLTPAIRRLAGIPAYLAGRYVRQSGTRTAVSVGALITAVALFASLVIMIYSFRQTVEVWTYQSVSGDLFLTTKLNEINQFRNP